MELSADLNVIAPSGKFSSTFFINDQQGVNYFTYERAFAYDETSKKTNTQYLDYELDGNEVSIYFDRDQMLSSGLIFPITIDPLVTATNTLPLASIGGSGYNAVCFAGGCSYGLTVNSPANAVITDILFSFNYIAQGACWMNDGAITFSYNGCVSPNIPGFFWFCKCNWRRSLHRKWLPIYNHLQACVPAPSCAPIPMNFGLRFYRCFQAGACSNTCIGANSPWTMTVRGDSKRKLLPLLQWPIYVQGQVPI